jgi:ornithine carbamoyltransferase
MMPSNLKGRSLLTLRELSAAEIQGLLDLAIEFKQLKRAGVFPRNLVNKNIALLFLKPSARTRVSFVVAASDEGAHLEMFAAEDIRFGVKESVKDIARIFGRMFDGIAFRGLEHSTIEEMARYAGIPVWNCLCDEYHPTQVLADLMTVQESFGHLRGIRMAYVGDGRNNMATTLAIGARAMGIDLRIVSPKALQPDAAQLARCKPDHGEVTGTVTLTEKVEEGVRDCHIVYTDVWVSMGEEAKTAERIALLKPYKVTADMMAATKRADSIFMHCLPAFHDLSTEAARKVPDMCEVADDVFESPQSRVFDQAENRMHTAKALMVATV